jgi:hypothetical protein
MNYRQSLELVRQEFCAIGDCTAIKVAICVKVNSGDFCSRTIAESNLTNLWETLLGSELPDLVGLQT